MAGGLGALAARSLGAASPAEAAGAVQLGVGNSETTATSLLNSAASPSAIGLVGSSTAAGATGLQGVASGSNGKGVYGSANTGTGAMGVYGTATQGHGVQGYGVIGVVGNGTTWGVYGNTGASGGIGVNATAVHGTAVQATGGTYGVRVKAASNIAFVNDPGPAVGIFAQGTSGGGQFSGGDHGVSGTGGNFGVQASATANSGIGVQGTGDSIGVKGIANSTTEYGYGVSGQGSWVGGVFTGGNNCGADCYGFLAGVRGTGTAVKGNAIGVYGDGSGASAGYGVFGTGTYAGVYGKAYATSGNYGVYCEGNMAVTGTINPTAVVQLIDHPQDPEHKWLAHALIAAPEPLNVYRGTVTLDATGAATVNLPGYFSAFNEDATCQLTAVGAAAPNLHVAKKVAGNRFGIAGGAPGQEVFWQVSGVRQDAYAAAHPLRVETRKSRKDQGTLMFVPKGSNAKPMQSGPKALPRAPRPPMPTR
jgi:hypothetical protein